MTTCRNCKERFLACHDTCEKYLSQKATITKNRDKDRAALDYICRQCKTVLEATRRADRR